MEHLASSDRYNDMKYRKCGQSGLHLPVLSLGLWHNFGGVDNQQNAAKILHRAFDAGISHFDLANNYGPPPGSAEENFGIILSRDFKRYRDEMIISTKAGYLMWPGPYGEWGSRKYILASLDQSLKRMGLDYVDIFYSHRYDPETPLDETMGALHHAVQQGKALYAGISNYPAEKTEEAVKILRNLGTNCLIHQEKYSLFQRTADQGLSKVLMKEGVGCIAFSPLAQGLLTDRYITGIPTNSRAGKPHGFLRKEQITPEIIKKVNALNNLAADYGISLAELALNWVKSQSFITSVLVGVSTPEQLDKNLHVCKMTDFGDEILEKINSVLL
ncbi:MAG: L-glyceraldehyde 3-phosphate reductase [Bacteroidetes bacterium]|jgi:L-glyceraldehyde 3-phosphate reductase|nr:L-glyceraldehyde 3-phosphate reductase [Bacteroidota bacterium]MBT5425893.1 L-glyceraldehyde 3-phosphate reductase [Bacteroidota bacterium]MBT7465411.1 L-glyceraldehyde 3-phosphate reductase [Bacteroidota bacterium]